VSAIIEAESGALAAVSKTPPDELANKKRADSFLALADQLTIESQDDYEFAAGELRTVKILWDTMEKERTSFTKPLNDVLDKLNARFQPYLKALCGDGKRGTVCAESIIKGKMAVYLEKEAARAREAQRLAEEAAAAERRRLEAEAAAERQRAAAAAAEIARQERERAEAARKEQARLDALAASAKSAKAREAAAAAAEEQRLRDAAASEAAAAEAEHAREQAEQRAQAIETTAAVMIAPVAVAPVKTAGISAAKPVEFEVVDMLALVQHIATKRPDLVVLLTVETTKLRALVKMMGLKTDMPGVRVFEATQIRVR